MLPRFPPGEIIYLSFYTPSDVLKFCGMPNPRVLLHGLKRLTELEKVFYLRSMPW